MDLEDNIMEENSIIFEVKDLVKKYAKVCAVDGVSAAIKKGEAVFIVGPSGSGKSTFLRCLNKLEHPTSGSILFHGKRVADNPRAENHFRENVGMVFQHFNLFPHLTIKENITLAPVLTKRLSKEEANIEAEKLLARIGLADKADSYPLQLSGGQKQRVAIIRALAMKPEVLLFDEPTSALDPEMVGEVLSLMNDLAKEGMTMIVVTHEIGFACEVADRIIFMDNGKIIEQGPPREITKNSQNPRVRDFFQKILNV